MRLLLTHASLTTDGRAGWPKPVAEYLAPRYGYAPDRVPTARARAIETLRLLDAVLADSRSRGHAYFLGPEPDGARSACGGRSRSDPAAARGRVPHAGARPPRVRDARSGGEGGGVTRAARTPRPDVQPAPGAAGSILTAAMAAATSASVEPRVPGHHAGERRRRGEGSEAPRAFAQAGQVARLHADGVVFDHHDGAGGQ